MAVNSDFVWNIFAKCLLESVAHNQELPLLENNKVAEKKSNFKKLLLAKQLPGNVIFSIQTNQ